MLTSETSYLQLDQWQQLAEKHRIKVKQWTVPYRRRKASHQQHPVLDFLFTYYPFSLGKLEQWHPGYGIQLECDKKRPERYQTKHYQQLESIVSLSTDALSDKELARLQWIHNLLCLTQTRTPNFACHGLHEWAMVYQGQDIRHRESTPLRLAQDEIDHLVSTRTITCSHFDAYRFFSPGALTLNKLKPTLDGRQDSEQCGCLHTNMDLYKWAYKSSPWISSDLLRETLFFAIEAREVDMRASPYDLTDYDYPPIPIETQEGRRQYEAEQLALYQKGLPLREKLIAALSSVLI